MRHTRAITAFTVSAAVFGTMAAAAVHAGSAPLPPKAREFSVSGPDGQPIRDAAGAEVKVRASDLQRLPQPAMHTIVVDDAYLKANPGLDFQIGDQVEVADTQVPVYQLVGLHPASQAEVDGRMARAVTATSPDDAVSKANAG